MIAVERRGRLGNQMFQFAFGIAAARMLGTELEFDDSLLRTLFVPGFHRSGTPPPDWPVVPVENDAYDSPETVLASLRDNATYVGYFQSERFFLAAEDDVRRAFELLPEHRQRFEQRYGELSDRDYVACHLRRTDYHDFAGGAALPLSWYRSALRRLDVAPETPIVFVGDDLEEARAELGDLPGARFEQNDEAVDLQLVANAAAVIVSNSSFGWWGAWLGERPGRRVLAPKHWLGFRFGWEYPSATIPERWTRVPVRLPLREQVAPMRMRMTVGHRAAAARRSLGPLRRKVRGRTARAWSPFVFAAELLRTLRTRLEIQRFGQRARIAQRFPGPRPVVEQPTVVAVVTHVAADTRPATEAVERLQLTLDALLESLGHTDLRLVLNTVPGRHVADELPVYLRDRLAVREQTSVEPMFVGFAAQAEFARHADGDWFLYTEDDLILHDGLLLEKLAFFNDHAPPSAVLLPHRYELWQGRKTYIDLVSKSSPEICGWNKLTILNAGDWTFAEFENPHSGFYCLSREQLERWRATGQHWHGKISHVAARESAATGALGEAFRLYKPHPENMSYLEIRHWDTKYSEQHASLHGGGSVS